MRTNVVIFTLTAVLVATLGAHFYVQQNILYSDFERVKVEEEKEDRAIENNNENNIAARYYVYSMPVYSSSEYGFQLQHPDGPNWEMRENREGEIHVLNYTDSRDRHLVEGDVKISTYIRDNPENLEILEWFEALPSDPLSSNTIHSKEEIIIDGQKSLRISETDYFGNEVDAVLIPLENGNILEIGIISSGFEASKIFNQVLDSFRYIDWSYLTAPSYGKTEIVFNDNLRAFIRQDEHLREIILKKDNEEIIVTSVPFENAFQVVRDSYLPTGGYPIPDMFSPKGNYFIYKGLGYEWYDGYIFDIAKKEKIEDIQFRANKYGFTDDEKYFYECAHGEMIGDDAEIYDLNNNKTVFDLSEEIAFSDKNFYRDFTSCEYNQDDNAVYFEFIERDRDAEEERPKTFKFNLETREFTEVE